MVDKKKVKENKDTDNTLNEGSKKSSKERLSKKESKEKDNKGKNKEKHEAKKEDKRDNKDEKGKNNKDIAEEEKNKKENKEDVGVKTEKDKEEKKERYAKNIEVEKRKIPKSKIHFPEIKETIKAMIMVFIITSIATAILFLFNLFSITVIQEVLKLVLE